MYIYDHRGRLERELNHGLESIGHAVGSGDGQFLALADKQQVVMSHLPTQQIQLVLRDLDQVQAVHLNPVATHLVVIEQKPDQAIVHGWDSRTKKAYRTPLPGLHVVASDQDPDGQQCLVVHNTIPKGSDESVAAIVSREYGYTLLGASGKAIATRRLDESTRQGLLVPRRTAAGEKEAVLLTSSGEVLVIDPRTGKRRLRLNQRTSIRAVRIAKLESNELLLVGFGMDDAFVWNLETGETVQRVRGLRLHHAVTPNRLAAWEAVFADSPWWVFPNDEGLTLVPRDVLDYVDRQAPRQLTRAERIRYRIPPEALPPPRG
ncbi:MAG: hypothetical protein KatS3mg105_5185 [Gemmatales bacterium]|nr:MAG: hypothetical protein KatS3mg105_5185 [Gemmatales bacterium]